MVAAAVHLGANVYCWSQPLQNRLLVSCLAPLADELRLELSFARLWFDRFDARGPHVMVVISVPPEAEAFALGRLGTALETFLAAKGAPSGLGADHAEACNLAVRGVALCQLDEAPGLAEEGSYALYGQPASGYPFYLTRGLSDSLAERIWDQVSSLSLWAVAQIAGSAGNPPVRAAIRWLASFEQELRLAHPRPEPYWRFHVGTLLFGLAKRLEDDETQALRSLPGAIGERNRENFARIWHEAKPGDGFCPALPSLVRDLVAAQREAVANPWALPREIVHWTLKQLCVNTRNQIPILLYAWCRNLVTGADDFSAEAIERAIGSPAMPIDRL